MHSLRDLDNRSYKHKLRAAAKERFGGTCVYCGAKPPVLTLDHIIAKSKGGFDVRSNLVGACRRCNNSKKSKELWQWWQSSPWWCEVRAERLSREVLICKMKDPVNKNTANQHQTSPSATESKTFGMSKTS